MTDIAGRAAFITGGANGIGLGIARALARSGAKLALADLDADALDRAQAELGALTQVTTAVLDVRDRDGFARAGDTAEATLGPISILINNAGVAGGAPADRLTYDLWDWGMQINLGGVINGIQTFLPRIAARGAGGHIVNTASVAGLIAGAGNTLYCTAKFAVTGMGEALHHEFSSSNIGVSVLFPGPVATDIIERTRAFQPKVTRSMSPQQRAAVFAAFERSKVELANGVKPDAVGEMVRDAILENRLYILTDRNVAEAVPARAQAMLDALPPAA